jgi:4-carboxymuconolactone decarboxylase
MIGRDRSQPGRDLMPRYQEMQESQLDDAQRRVFNDCKAGPRGSVPPPVHVWLKSPSLADNAHKLGAHVRFGTQFTPKQTEIAILMTARYWTAQFEWAAHVRLAQQAGLTQDVDAIADRNTPKFSDPDDQLVYDFCEDYYSDHRVSDATYERVVKRFGDKGIVDLAGLIGYYSLESTPVLH